MKGQTFAWLCVPGLLLWLGWMQHSGQRIDSEICAISEQNQQVRNALDGLKKAKAREDGEAYELSRLRRDQADLLRLRDETRRLLESKQQQATELRQVGSELQQAQDTLTPLLDFNDWSPTNADEARDVCLLNLWLLDNAKRHWVAVNRASAGTPVTAADLSPYMPTNALPGCRAGGVYTISPVGVPPSCSVHTR